MSGSPEELVLRLRDAASAARGQKLPIVGAAFDEAADLIERYANALRAVRAAITNENGLNSCSIVDTVWVSEIETAVDCIDLANKAEGEG